MHDVNLFPANRMSRLSHSLLLLHTSSVLPSQDVGHNSVLASQDGKSHSGPTPQTFRASNGREKCHIYIYPLLQGGEGDGEPASVCVQRVLCRVGQVTCRARRFARTCACLPPQHASVSRPAIVVRQGIKFSGPTMASKKPSPTPDKELLTRFSTHAH